MNVALRPVVLEDAQLIFDWQNIPNVRRFFRNPEMPQWREHVEWLSKGLKDQSKYLFVITCDSKPSGFLHLTRTDSAEFEISILVSPDWQGKGVASQSLHEIRRLFPFVTMHAVVHAKNLASQKLFSSCGFVKTDKHTYTHSPSVTGRSCVIRANSGIGVGLGHLRRCMELAKVLRENNWKVFFIEPPDSEALDLLCREGFETIITSDEAHAICQSAEGANLLLVDHYDINISVIAYCDCRTWKLAVFEDIGNRSLPVDIAINGSPSAKNIDFFSSGVKNAFAGTEYQIIRDDLRRLNRKINIENPKNILVTIGAGDPYCLLGGMIALFENYVCSVRHEVKFDIVVGPQVKEAYESGNEAITVHVSPDNMAELISNSDLAVSASGQTLMELLFAGVPTVALCLTENQLENIEALEYEKCVISAGRIDVGDWQSRLIDLLDLLINDVVLRRRLSKSARSMIDGKGAERIAAKIQELVGIERKIVG